MLIDLVPDHSSNRHLLFTEALADEGDASGFDPVPGVPDILDAEPVGGCRTDADIAAKPWDFLRLTEAHPRVIGLSVSGPWTDADLPGAAV